MKTLIICGTRPEIIKMAPVYQELKKNKMEAWWVHTGQHTTMADDLYDFFNIFPEHIIDLKRKDNSLSTLTSCLLESITEILLHQKPNLVLVHGDTHTGFCAALASFYLQIPVGHVEAGLRSGSIYDPFPEEMNRTLIGKIASVHFAPTEKSKANLLKEGIKESSIIVTGNTIIDAAYQINSSDHVPNISSFLGSDKYILVTAHRRENWGQPLLNICEAIDNYICKNNCKVVWPVHLNPIVKDVVFNWYESSPNKRFISLTDPLIYPDLLWLIKNSNLILTDSGGIQEEAVCFKKPIVVLRDTTERPEVIDSGLGILAGTSVQGILNSIELLKFKQCSLLNPYGDGTASLKIVNYIKDTFQ